MHERPTDTRWCSKESNAHIHRHSTTLAHTYIRTHAHTVTQTHAGYECTLSSFLVSLPVKIPSQFSAQARLVSRSFQLSPTHPLSTA
jgi:hypothetical protein